MARRSRKRKRKPSRWSLLLDRRQFVTGALATAVGTWIVSLTSWLPSLLPERPSYIGPPPLPPGRGWISQPLQHPQPRVNGSFIFGVPTPLRARATLPLE